MRHQSSGLRIIAQALLWSGMSALAHGADAPSQARQRADDPIVTIDGDVATFIFHAEADRVELTLGGEPESHALTRLPEGDDWTIKLQRPGFDRAVFSYRLASSRAGRKIGGALSAQRTWRGPHAPPAPIVSDVLKGTLDVAEVASEALGTRRKLTTYIPPGHDRSRPSPVIYAADGESVREFARTLEPLITTGQVPHIILVGVHSGGYLKDLVDAKAYDPEKDLRSGVFPRFEREAIRQPRVILRQGGSRLGRAAFRRRARGTARCADLPTAAGLRSKWC